MKILRNYLSHKQCCKFLSHRIHKVTAKNEINTCSQKSLHQLLDKNKLFHICNFASLVFFFHHSKYQNKMFYFFSDKKILQQLPLKPAGFLTTSLSFLRYQKLRNIQTIITAFISSNSRLVHSFVSKSNILWTSQCASMPKFYLETNNCNLISIWFHKLS